MQHWYALALFSVLSTITPGPNNLMIMTSSMNFGIRKSLPHFLGITTGFPLMVVAMGLGLNSIFAIIPGFQTLLLLLSAGMMIHLAWRTATFMPAPSDAHVKTRPLRYLEAVLFQWVNPKAWFMATGAVALFPATGSSVLAYTTTMALLMSVVGVVCVGVWMLMGMQLRAVINTPGRLRAFNGSMAVSLLAFFGYSVFVSV
ncbi:MAG TPA: LysE family translocator [Limnobacter sp.]|nr:LysE family translocator [Limnobacter sp.]